MPKTVIFDKSQYYEAIFQLRDADEKLMDFTAGQIEKGGKKAYASKIVYYKNGADLYLSSTSFAIALGRSLQKNFGGTLKISKKLFTKSKKTGKIVYRVSVLFRPFSFAVGDILKTRGRLFRITGVGDRVGCIDIKTGKKAVIADVGNFEKSKVYDAFVSKK